MVGRIGLANSSGNLAVQQLAVRVDDLGVAAARVGVLPTISGRVTGTILFEPSASVQIRTSAHTCRSRSLRGTLSPSTRPSSSRAEDGTSRAMSYEVIETEDDARRAVAPRTRTAGQEVISELA